MRPPFLCIALFALASCTGGAGAGQRLKPVANPSQIVATELAFARAAREDGQWTAFRKYAADGALIFGREGAFEAKPWLAKQKDPAQSVSWQPLAVWSSCDGTLAVSQFAFVDPNDATQGQGYTVWQRERNGDYRWVFDFGWPTDAAPEQPDMIAAKVAQCGQRTDIPGQEAGPRRSADGSLTWSFTFSGDRTRNFNVWTAEAGGAMTPAIQVSIPPSD